MGTEEEGVDEEEEEGVAVAVFKLGAGGPLTDKSIPQTRMDEVPGVAEASREVGGGGGVLILGNMLYLLPYPRHGRPHHLTCTDAAIATGHRQSRRCCHCHGCRRYHYHVRWRYHCHCHRRHCQYRRRFHGRLCRVWCHLHGRTRASSSPG